MRGDVWWNVRETYITAQKESLMRGRVRSIQTLCLVVFIGALLALAGCTYYTAVSKLSPQEQAEFRAHRKLMSAGQVQRYLAQPTPGARAAYLEEIGSAQRFAALDQADREAVLAGYIRTGMSAEALRFLWGYPYSTEGYKDHYEYWYYIGSTMDLAGATFGSDAGTMVKVYLLDGRVKWWLETVPTTSDDDGGEVEKNRK
jgi:outer membrane protein assembly factor BamE (lipoprotein component of BamABCDE complex)